MVVRARQRWETICETILVELLKNSIYNILADIEAKIAGVDNLDFGNL